MQTVNGNDGKNNYYMAYLEKIDRVIVWVNGKFKYLIDSKTMTCDCPGFKYHGHCKHVDFATQELNFNGKVVKPRLPIRKWEEEYYTLMMKEVE